MKASTFRQLYARLSRRIGARTWANRVPNDLLLPTGYRINEPRYFADAQMPFTYQPHVYALARFIADRAGLRNIVDLGCGNGHKLRPFAGRFNVVAVDVGPNLELVAQAVPSASRIEFDLGQGFPPLDEAVLRNAVVILADVVEHLVDPTPLLKGLQSISQVCPYVLVSTPDRDRVRGPGDMGPPANPAHIREWNLSEFTKLLVAHGLRSDFVGFTINTDFHRCKSTLLALLGREVTFSRAPSVKPCAIVHAYNEADVVEECVRHLTSQGCSVVLVDNWSTDDTYERAVATAKTNPSVLVRRFPNRPTTEYQWKLQLEETVRIAESSGADWILHNDADEFRYSPWKGITLADGFALVNALGYSAVDFTVLDFRYLRGQPVLSRSVREELLFFEFGRRPGHFAQIKAWRNQPRGSVDLASSGGHEAKFVGRRVFPLKFLMRHYPLRSPEQARRKIIQDRVARSRREYEERGWHTQYLNFDESRYHGWEPENVVPWNEAMFAAEYLVERLSGIGLGQPI
jgi:glycosyltransferase involved in cell wall biosynthesis